MEEYQKPWTRDRCSRRLNHRPDERQDEEQDVQHMKKEGVKQPKDWTRSMFGAEGNPLVGSREVGGKRLGDYRP